MTDVFDGRTITGDVNHYTEGLKPQDDPQLFIDALDKLLAVPGVTAVRWCQYTPYFNDGDPCVFSIYGARVAVANDTPNEGEAFDGDYDEAEAGEQIWRSSYEFKDYSDPSYGYYNRPLIKLDGADAAQVKAALEEFEDVLESGTHYVVLNEKFGDPAEVTADAKGFHVEFYEHD